MKSKNEVEKMLKQAIKEQEKNKAVWGKSYWSVTEVWVEDNTKIDILKQVLEVE